MAQDNRYIDCFAFSIANIIYLQIYPSQYFSFLPRFSYFLFIIFSKRIPFLFHFKLFCFVFISTVLIKKFSLHLSKHSSSICSLNSICCFLYSILNCHTLKNLELIYLTVSKGQEFMHSLVKSSTQSLTRLQSRYQTTLLNWRLNWGRIHFQA